MLQKYYTIALRNLLRNKTFSIINIAGLAVGLACFLLISAYLVDELSYDRYPEQAKQIYRLQPYKNDSVPASLHKLFATAAQGDQANSWADMSLEVDPQNGLIYGVDTLARKIAAFKIASGGIKTVWKKTQTTTEWATLIGPADKRVWVGTDIPNAEIPGKNKTDQIVFRDAATGKLLAKSDKVPVMTQGSAIQPGYGGSVFFPGATGTLVKATPVRGPAVPAP